MMPAVIGRRWLLLFLILPAQHLAAESGLELRPLLHLYTAPRDVTIDDILNGKGRFSRSDQTVPNPGVLRDAVWARFTLKAGMPSTLLLSLELPSIDRMDLYTLQSGRLIHKEVGRLTPLFLREKEDRHPTVTLPYNPQEENVYYLRVISDVGIALPVVIRNEDSYYRQAQRDTLVQGFYFGWIAVMILYNLFLYSTTGEKGHLLYAVTLFFSNLFFQLSLNGYLALYLVPSQPAVAKGIHNYIYIFSLLSSCGLAIHILATKRHAPLMHRFLQGGMAVVFMLFLVSAFLPFYVINRALDYVAAVLLVLFFSVALSVHAQATDRPYSFLLALVPCWWEPCCPCCRQWATFL